MKTIPLTIAPEYVPAWGEWECVRELIQNALDEPEHSITWEGGDLVIRNRGVMKYEHLLLGRTDKRGIKSKIGQHGEGFKLAMLVACRLDVKPIVNTGTSLWVARIEHSPTFDCEVLTFDCYEDVATKEEDREYTIVRIAVKDPAAVKARYQPDLPINVPLKKPEHKGHIFVHGLWVCEMPDLEYGYNFTKDRISLDRDRGTVDGWSLEAATASVWMNQKSGGLAAALRGSRDTRSIGYYAGYGQTIAQEWDRDYAQIVPVSSQEEISMAQAAGRRWKLVPQGLKDLLWAVRGFFIPSIGTPAQRIRKWLDTHKGILSASAVSELEDIAKYMEEQNVK